MYSNTHVAGIKTRKAPGDSLPDSGLSVHDLDQTKTTHQCRHSLHLYAINSTHELHWHDNAHLFQVGTERASVSLA
jgi:hypothetical protein